MPGRNIIRFINSLKQKKNRLHYRLFIIEGEKAVDELTESGHEIHSVCATGEWLSERRLSEGMTVFPGRGQNSTTGKIPLHKVSDTELSRISSLKTPNRVLAVVHMPSPAFEPENLAGSLTLFLDNIQDPGNLGTLIRSAHWFGIDNIILTRGSAEVTNPKVIQATMGSILRVRTHYVDPATFFGMPEIAGLPVFGAFAGAPDIYSAELPGHGLIILGNESQGISGEVEKFITRKIGIPPFPGKGKSPESLNMAVAGSIIISEFRRRRPVIIQNERK